MHNVFPASVESEAVRLSIDTHALCELIEQHEMLTDAVHAMAQMFYVVKDERLLFCNQKLVDFLGLPVGVMARGTPWDDLLDALIKAGVAGAVSSPEAFKETVKKRHAAGKPYTAERELEDGRWLRIDVIPCPSQEIIVTYTEITELKHAQMKAQSAEKAKSAFLANMSHEIRTPMNGVMGMAELLSGTNLDSKQKAFADIILKSGEALLTIINDILDFSKIDAGKMTLHPAPFVLAEAIEDVATLISARIASKRLELAVRIDPKLPEMLVGDVGRLRQIITNLMGNAAKFTDEGHILVSVSGEDATGPDGAATKLTFRVEDTGIGIPADKCEAIFEKFSQVDDSAARKHEGTGLGLAIASSLVKLMGGDIGVESRVGAGSTFWFTVTLPVHGEKRAAKIVPGDVSGARVLVIDDNAVNRTILEEQLRAWRFDGAYCASGIEGLTLMREAVKAGAGYDLVILDHHMPQMTGAEVAMLARCDPALAATPIIMLTSVDEAKDGSGFLSLGVEAHLVKPARSSLLFNTIVEVLQARTRRVRAPAPVAAVETANGHGAEAAAQTSGGTPPPAVRAAAGDDRVDILVAEDNDVNRLVFIQILEDAGYSFRLVADGEEAVAAHLAHKPRIILMDVSMPKMNGFEATQAIRSADAKAGVRTPIIAVTAHAIKDDREKCLAAGMDDYVSKPISPARLRERIEHWIEAAASAAA